ncbi:hypothetical protein LCGC14_0837820 [marine sediment metagenome]|uniref:Acetate kinase n=2 Tax=root TaxID=1 RepID=A0A831QRK3_9FLAO|nr:acetate/propionate family kinase [Pricia antarctica]
MQKNRCVLAINGGSSSIKFALYEKADVLVELLSGAIDNIGSEKAGLSFTKANDAAENNIAIDASSHGKAVEHLKACLDKHVDFDLVVAIGHRIVHGMSHIEPELITDDLIMELKKISSIDPEHLHGQIALIEMFKKWYPALQQVTCFDTSFHTTMPVVAKLLAIPRTYYKKGVQRYGFHGLSYAFLMEELHRICGETSKTEKIILAHLGSGASLAAVKNGKSIDTSMGFTPTSGLPMGTRTGDLDPGVVSYLMEHEKLDAKAFNDTVIHKSGLLGISETNSNMKSLIELEDLDYRAKEAIEFFCYQTKKWIGSFAAALGGLETLVFSGGIGERSPEVRAKICDGLAFLGIELDDNKNHANELIISKVSGRVKVYVIKTKEELMIAKLVRSYLNTH